MTDRDGFSPDEEAQIRSASDALQRAARDGGPTPRPDLGHDIMAAIAQEPAPAPASAVVAAARARRASGVVAGLRDAWRVAFGTGRPIGVRASSVLVVLMTVAAVGGIGGGAAAAAWLATHPSPTETPLVSPVPATPSPAPTRRPAVSPSAMVPSAGASMGQPTPMPTMTVPAMTPRPTAMPTMTNRPTAMPTMSPRPTAMPTMMPKPSGTGMQTHGPGATHRPGG